MTFPWDFTLKEGSIVQIDSDEYEKATQGGISTSVEPNGNTSEQDVTDFVYGMYEYRDGSEYLIAEVGYSFETDCDYVIIYYYYEDNDAVCEVLNLSRNADGTYTGEGTEYSTVATVTFTDEAMNVFIDSTDEPACEKMTANYVLTSEIDYNM